MNEQTPTEDSGTLAAATYIGENTESLVAEWEQVARSNVDAARHASRKSLRNHISELLHDLKTALMEVDSYKSARAASGDHFESQWSEQHGLNRASQNGYTAEEVVREYVILRRVVTDRLQNRGLDDFQTIEAINCMFELASLNALKTFMSILEESREKIIATLVHDIRSPIATAISGLEVIRENLEDRESVEQLLPVVTRSSYRALNVLSGLLDDFILSSPTGLNMQFEEIDLTEAFKKPLEDFSQIYPSRLEFELPAKSLRGVFSIDMLVRVLDNLVSNAFRYGSRKEPIVVTLRDEGDEAILIVCNQGSPIPEKRQRDMFRMFKSFDNRRENAQEAGWGLGLTHVKLVAQAHDGGVKVKSSEREGTTFSVSLKKNSHTPGKYLINFSEQVDTA